MYVAFIRLLGIFLLTCLLSGCAALQQLAVARTIKPMPLPPNPLYVLAVAVNVYNENELVIVDPDTWQVLRRTPLLAAAPWDLSRDPQGRVWIGYGATPGKETRVQVFAPDGRLLKTLSPCITPYLPIHFAAGRAFIPCLQTGSYASVAIVNLNSLDLVQLVDVRIADDDFLLSGTGGGEDYFVLAGGGHSSNRVILLDTHTLTLAEPVLVPANNVMTILPYQERFYLLNSVAEVAIRKGWSEPLPAGRPDLLTVDTNPTPTFAIHPMIAPGALWGAIQSDTLYAYHDAQQMNLIPDSFRAISRLNLITNEAELWPLPDNWKAEDLAIVTDQIILTYSSTLEVDKSGLYRFDPTNGELTLLVNIPGAQRLLSPTE